MQIVNRIRSVLGLPPSLPADPVERNLTGQTAEKAGDIDRAITLYEANVAARHDAPFPYERLRIIYTRQKKYEDALRVIRAYLAIIAQQPIRGEWATLEHWQNCEKQILKRIKPPQ